MGWLIDLGTVSLWYLLQHRNDTRRLTFPGNCVSAERNNNYKQIQQISICLV